MKWLLLFAILLLLPLVTAFTSSNYELINPTISSGGDDEGISGTIASFTNSINYDTCLGFFCGITVEQIEEVTIREAVTPFASLMAMIFIVGMKKKEHEEE